MPTFAFDKILRIIQILCTILQAVIAAFTGNAPSQEDAE